MDGGFEDARERAPWTRHDPTYGIFAESDSDSDDNDGSRSRSRKRHKGAAEADLSKPVFFVSAGNATPSQQPERAFVARGANDDNGIKHLPTSFGKISNDAAGARREGKDRETDAAARRRQASAFAGQPAPAVGSVMANATVANIMKGMGYEKGKGLGKHGQVIPVPVEVMVRPKNAGLGTVEGVKKPNPIVSPAKENLPPGWSSPAPASSSITERQQQQWSKKKASGSKAPVLTKHEMLAMRAEQEEEEQPAVVQKVIDMRGPQPRVLTTLERLNEEQQMIVADDAPLPELQYNMRFLVDEAEADVVMMDGHLRREQEKAASLAREKESLTNREASQRRQLQAMETISVAIEQVRMDDAAGVLDLDGLLQTFQDLKARFREEFKMCGVAWIACQFAHPLLLRAFQGWQPLQDPSFGLDTMSSWKDLLEADQPYDFSHGAASMPPYAQLVSELVLPAVRMAGTNSWEARDAEPMLQLLAAWEQLLPPVVLQSILEHVAMPKLSAAVDSWDPRKEKVPIHLWVHPWLGVLDQRSVQTLCHSVRYKMSSALQAWQVHDKSAHTLLSPWKNVFDPAIWNDPVARYIVPKLKLAMQEFQINPADQKLHQFRWVMIWASEIPFRILEADFFSKWQYVLYQWLSSSNPDFNEIINWYEGWKGLFPPELLANERVQAHLAAGLGMMNEAAEGLEVVQPQPGGRGNLGCLRGSEERHEHEDATMLPCYSAEQGGAMANLSFKDRIQAFAMDKGLLFMPRVGKFYSGMPVYEFGTANICIDSVKRVVYAQLLKESERWAAVSLKQLMDMNMMRRTR